MTKDEALKLALEKFEFMNHVDSIFEGEFNFQINAIKEALAQPEQEPVQWGVDWGKAGETPCVSIIKRTPNGGIKVVAVEYGPPPQRTWVELRWSDMPDQWLGNVAFMEGGKWAEKTLKEKNNE